MTDFHTNREVIWLLKKQVVLLLHGGIHLANITIIKDILVVIVENT